ncbi:putative membrane protein [Streptomyces viridochromogenes Tue57]|uniref:Putative membrane protein n=1 Tax=Streptomyces viridochromogenes Tue57 TaxID=1160705 RepID=L8PG64_STRVR|nr:putative membrane protein [Streptomyces viridochromogenes Tue57]
MFTSAEETPAASLAHWVTSPTAAAMLLVALALTAGWRWQRARKPGHGQRRRSAAIPVAAVAAIGCTAYSADTSWRFAADYLDMGGAIERAAMFAAAELALFATALMARQNLNGPKRAPGVPGTLTWVITGVQVVPAYAESGPVGGTVRAFVGPVLAAMLWHLAMGIELRNHTPHADSRSLAAVIARQARERLVARLGIADRDADAARIIRERALDRAVTLILRAEAMKPEKRAKWRGRRLTRRLHHALEQADVDRDERQDELLLRKLATRQQALALATVPLPARWPGPAASTSGNTTTAPRATASKRAEAAGRPPSKAAGDDTAARAARAQPGVRPQQPARTTSSPELKPGGEPPGDDPGRTSRAEPNRQARKPRATRDLLIEYADRLYHEHGRLSRDLLEEAVRADGYSVGSDIAGEVVRTFKAKGQAARADHPH